ncbi:MAG: M20/M25/M40 family metallo-hydrolase [Lachnospiraceae bacterium]|nr:M20/M25/M40 family metallo-hydrolase [Lachnospiraceae bacterium]
MYQIDEEIFELAKELVRIPSVNGTEGEKTVDEYIEAWFRKVPYYRDHPKDLIIQKIPGDPLDRRSVLAILRGTKDDIQREASIPTVLLHGHTDTVGIEDYGSLKKYATDPDALTELLRTSDDIQLPADAREDLLSGEYCFGRGMSDMKSGDAVFMVLMKRLSEHPEDIRGNLVASFNPVEENAHSGIISSLPALVNLREREGFRFIAAFNNDFTTRLYADDEKVTIYTGMGGKILPCFYIQGRETHVGQCFEGFDASMMAAEILRVIQLSTKYADVDKGEMASPPSVLKLKDLKDFYNVQTSREALVYFNYFVLGKSMNDITQELKEAARDACFEVCRRIRKNREAYTAANSLPDTGKEPCVCILSYAELMEQASGRTGFTTDRLKEIVADEKAKGTDVREIPVALIRYLLSVCGITSPAIVLYYAAPYVPHCTLRYSETEQDAQPGSEQAVYMALRATLDSISSTTGTAFRILHYYPSLSDSSYIRIDDDDSSIRNLKENFPAIEDLYPIPIDAIRSLDIPPINIGVRGRDAHKWTERVHVPYTFGTLPALEHELILKLLQ